MLLADATVDVANGPEIGDSPLGNPVGQTIAVATGIGHNNPPSDKKGGLQTGSSAVDEVLKGLGGATAVPGGKSAVPNFEAEGADLQGVEEGLRGQGIDLKPANGGVLVGVLPGEKTVVVRPGSSSDGRPTVEVQRKNTKGRVIKESETRIGPKPSNSDSEQEDDGNDTGDQP